MTSRRSYLIRSLCHFRHWMHRPLLAVLLGAVVAAGSGCTGVVTMKIKDAFPDPDTMSPSGPAVTVLPIQESTEPGRYATDQTYLGKGLAALIGLGPFFIPPVVIYFGEAHSDTPRTDIVRMAVLSKLKQYGVPATYQAEGGADGLKMLPGSRLGISMRLRTLDVDTSYPIISDTLIVSAIAYSGWVAHAVLDCQLWQQGKASPLWEGVGEGRYGSRDFNKKSKEKDKNYKENAADNGKAVGEAVSIAVDQCITRSGLLNDRSGPAKARTTEAGKTNSMDTPAVKSGKKSDDR